VELLSVQYLRGFAALMIVFFHLQLQLHRIGYDGYWPHFLRTGVDIFFVISGFIMWVTTAKGVTTVEFFRRRIIRVAPLYWLLTSAVLATLIAFPNAVQSGRFETWHVVGSYLFFPVVHPVEGVMQPLLIPGWTLNYEMFFYAVFGVGLMLSSTARLIFVSVILFGLAATPYLMTVSPLTPLGFYTSGIILEFAYGMALGWLYIRGAKLSPASAWTCFLLGLVAIALVGSGNMYDSVLFMGIAALLVVGGAVMIERVDAVPNIRALHLLGNASYSLYLSHAIVLSLIGQFWRRSSLYLLSGASFAFGCVAVVSAIAVGVLIYHYIEVPMLRLGGLRVFRVNIPMISGRGLSGQPQAPEKSA
jgi:exopolysaccharide production protein ExoZ